MSVMANKFYLNKTETKAYIQKIALGKKLELISIDRRRVKEKENKEFKVKKRVVGMIVVAEG